MPRCRLAVVFCWILFPSAGAPAEPPTVLPASALQGDVAILQQAYEALHPGLYRYNSPEQMAAHFAELRRALDHDQTLTDAFLALSAFTASIRCGHTYPNFYNQPKAVQVELFQHPDRMPFLFRWIRHRMIVTGIQADAGLTPGMEVLSIDGIPAAAILDRLLPYSRADGSNTAKRIANLEVTGNDTFEAFDLYFPMLFPPKGTTRELAVRTVSGEETTVTVSLITPEQRIAPLTLREASLHGGDTPIWSLDRLDSRTSLMRMPSWALYDSKWDWEHWLDTAFNELTSDRVRNLIIDLRHNEGGSSVGDRLIAHLIAHDQPEPAYRRLVRYRKVPADLLPFLDTWDHSFDDWGLSAIDNGNGFFRLTRYDDSADGIVIRTIRPRYRGRVWVMVDASNSSATFEFERDVQSHGLATLVGEPTGGNRRGINGGAFYFLRLPHSKLEVDLPLIGQFPTTAQPDEGLQPDVEVTPSVADIASDTDTGINTIRRRIADNARPH